jgi:hypothetical protein
MGIVAESGNSQGRGRTLLLGLLDLHAEVELGDALGLLEKRVEIKEEVTVVGEAAACDIPGRRDDSLPSITHRIVNQCS